MEKTVISAISGYFNQGDGKRSMSDFRDELKALSDAEKRELAQGACKAMEWTLK